MTITKGMKINQRIKQRVLNVANTILEEKVTVRQVADKFNTSKSTVHKDMNERLPIINRELYIKVRKVLDYHLSIRHLRGGEATRIAHKGKPRKVG
jgi:putative DeoR family transcriptional regulator (stage III sporulation protein D)